MPDATWKMCERQVARRLGGERAGPQGAASDVNHPWLSVEVKHRQGLPEWLKDAMEQAARNCTDADRLPIVVLHESGQRYGQSLVMMRLDDFCEWFANWEEVNG